MARPTRRAISTAACRSSPSGGRIGAFGSARAGASDARAWAAAIPPLDEFVFVTLEGQHCTSAARKNAIDYLYGEWVDKATGFVSYGSAGGVRAVEHLRGILA